MQIPLERFIERVLKELEKLGMAENTIKSYARSAYVPLRNYCARNGTTCYEPAVLNNFLNSQKERLENSEIDAPEKTWKWQSLGEICAYF